MIMSLLRHNDVTSFFHFALDSVYQSAALFICNAVISSYVISLTDIVNGDKLISVRTGEVTIRWFSEWDFRKHIYGVNDII